MRSHTDCGPEQQTPQAFEGLQLVELLDDVAASLEQLRSLTRPSRDDWRLSRSAKPLRTWRLSK